MALPAILLSPVALRADPANGRADAEGRWRRVVRLGGRGVEIEAAALGRLRWRRV